MNFPKFLSKVYHSFFKPPLEIFKGKIGCGNADFERALEIAKEVGVSEEEIAEEIREALKFSSIVDRSFLDDNS